MTGTQPTKQGFTLIEMLVTVSLFMIIVTVAVGAFTNALRTQRQVSTLISAESNIDLGLEQMAREVRTGYLFCNTPGNTVESVGNSPGPGAESNCDCTLFAQNPQWWSCPNLSFYTAEGQHVEYSTQDGQLAENTDVDSATSSFQSVTGDQVQVQNLQFLLFGQVEGDHWTPRVTISMTIVPSSTDTAIAGDEFNIETTVSAREIDCTTAGGTISC